MRFNLTQVCIASSSVFVASSKLHQTIAASQHQCNVCLAMPYMYANVMPYASTVHALKEVPEVAHRHIRALCAPLTVDGSVDVGSSLIFAIRSSLTRCPQARRIEPTSSTYFPTLFVTYSFYLWFCRIQPT